MTDGASGRSLIQMLKAETGLPVLPVNPLGDKLVRAHAAAPLAKSDHVFLPDQAAWLRELHGRSDVVPNRATR
jgi:predicted phage terminase large subunit-like protein